MYPVLFTVFGVPVPTYGLLFLTAILTAVAIGRVQARALGLDPGRVTDLIIVSSMGGLIAAKLLYVAMIAATRGTAELDLLLALRSGGIWYGGVLGGLATGAVFARWHGMDYWLVTDVVIPGTIIAHGIGRLGCFFAGCCFGRPTDALLAVTFTDPFSGASFGTPLGIPLHPVQLYEFAAEAAIGLGLILLSRRRAFPGQVVSVYLILYGPLRFLLETLRGDYRGEWIGGALSTSQLLGIGSVLAGAALYAAARRASRAATRRGGRLRARGRSRA